MQGVDFDVEEVEKLKQVIASAPEQELHDSLDILVDQIFKGQEIAGDEMSFKQWKNWITQLDGVNEVLDD